MDVRTVCLGILTIGEATGYEIKKMIEEGAFDLCVEASFGSIYPALSKLTDEGFVDCRQESQDGRPDRKVYSLTEEGRALFKELLVQPPSEDKHKSDFMFVSLFSGLLPAGHMSHLIDDRIQWLTEERDRVNKLIEKTDQKGAQFVRGYSQALFETAIRYLEENRNLIETENGTVSGKRKNTARAGVARAAAS